MDKIVISHIGLSPKDLILLKNLSRLDETWFGNFQLADEPNTADGQILIMDVDHPDSAAQWERLKPFAYFENTIVLSRRQQQVIPNTIQLTRPLQFRRLTEALHAATASGDKVKRHERNILVVDDTLPVRTFMTQKLHEILTSDIGVEVAESGEEAIIMAANQHFDLVFMDVMMPGMDGYQACRKIKALSGAKVVMLTSKSSTLNRVKAKMSGCDGYITKPPEDRELVQVIRRYLEPQRAELPQTMQLAAAGR
ncbi:response regulator [Hahella sp. CCB-MM4]|uniref:response regulator n=1 Tax=Hahella sp. (strain CCB-MM4) TaxID=1926491 RepID=UPI000B9ADF07|nr:response regulator [Hahella sp. CCB-MM4]OZG72068.1 response regulator [Hahella sp. CCB-MM4]